MPARAHVTWPGEARFCPACGTPLEVEHVYGRNRGVCPSCGRIEFRTPAIGVAVVVHDDLGRLLMVKRGPEATRAGHWSIPAGFMDYGEDVREAGARELLEETGLEVEVGDVIQVATNFHDPAKLAVGIWFEGRVVGGSLEAGDDAEEAAWFRLEDLPELAFDTDRALIDRLASISTLGGTVPDPGERTD